MFKRVLFVFTVVLSLLTPAALANAEETEHGTEHNAEHHGFNAGNLLVSHVLDSYFLEFFGLELPLPIIVSGSNGVDIFMSNNFHVEHGAPASNVYTAASGSSYQIRDGKVFEVTGGEFVRPFDLSITKNVVALIVVVLLLFFIFKAVASKYKADPLKAPSGLAGFLEPLILFIRDEVAKPAIGHGYERFMPFLLNVFFFIFFANLLGLIPFFGFNLTGNIAVALTFALFTFIIMLTSAKKDFWLHLVAPPGVPKGLLILMIPIELFGLISKPVVLTLRLFANITAGHMIILAFISLIFIFGEKFGTGAGLGTSVLSLFFAIFMNTMELLVAFLQAYVFCLLSALYFGSAVEEAHH